MVNLRDYQLAAVNKSQNALQRDKSTLLVMATGLGKTTIAAEIARQQTGNVLMVAHRRELVVQAYKRMVEHTGKSVGIEMGSKHHHGESIIIGSVQSLVNRDIPTPSLIIVDEAHHAVSTTYKNLFFKHYSAKILGVTATADRADKICLSEVFDSVAYRYETYQAIEDGWLAPIFQQKVYGVSGLIGAAGDRRTIVFTPNVAEAIEVAGLLPSATYVHGGLSMSERDTRIEAFKAGTYQYIVNCNILTEGFDSPEIKCVAMMRATQSRALFVQCIGRGLRLAPDKNDCLYLDLVDMPPHDLEGPRDVL